MMDEQHNTRMGLNFFRTEFRYCNKPLDSDESVIGAPVASIIHIALN